MMPLPHGVTELAIPEAGSEVRVFQSDLDALPPAETLLPELDETERVRAAAFAVDHARRSFIRRRWVRRLLVASAHGFEPQTLRIESDRLGRPSIVSPAALRSISISTSSSGRFALIAWSRTRPLGVDIARIDASHATADAARLFMTSHEMDAWVAGGCSPHLFFRIWTRKEAVLKLMGTGFAADATAVDVLEEAPAAGPLVIDVPTREAPGWIAALAR